MLHPLADFTSLSREIFEVKLCLKSRLSFVGGQSRARKLMLAILIFAFLSRPQSDSAPVVAYDTVSQAATRTGMSLWLPKQIPHGYAIASVEAQKVSPIEKLGLPGRTVIHLRLLNKSTKHSIHLLQTLAAPRVSTRDHGKWLLNGTGFRLEFKPGNVFAARRYAGQDFLVTAPMMSERALGSAIQELVEVKPK